jgi:hypothetical protein
VNIKSLLEEAIKISRRAHSLSPYRPGWNELIYLYSCYLNSRIAAKKDYLRPSLAQRLRELEAELELRRGPVEPTTDVSFDTGYPGLESVPRYSRERR